MTTIKLETRQVWVVVTQFLDHIHGSLLLNNGLRRSVQTLFGGLKMFLHWSYKSFLSDIFPQKTF